MIQHAKKYETKNQIASENRKNSLKKYSDSNYFYGNLSFEVLKENCTSIITKCIGVNEATSSIHHWIFYISSNTIDENDNWNFSILYFHFELKQMKKFQFYKEFVEIVEFIFA